jgi:hypothetical protein
MWSISLRADVTKSQFEADLNGVLIECQFLSNYSGYIKSELERRDLPALLPSLNRESQILDRFYDFLDEYGDFLDILDRKFSIEVANALKLCRRIIGDLKTSILQMKTAVSQSNWDSAKTCSDDIEKNVVSFRETFGIISTVPERIDYSKLGPEDWKLIGIPGLHYPAKVFLSYHWRDKNPNKDTNEMMITAYIKPMLQLLDIEPVTLRDHLRPQDQVEDRATQLIGGSDGIIGFYTTKDSVGNVEHELSQSHNIVAICAEIGATTPSMRRARWQIEFSREQMGDLVLELAKALKEKKLFRLAI